MKKFLLSLCFFPLIAFGAGDTTKQPASIQRVSNATLTCPAGKWCKVNVTAKATYRYNYLSYGGGIYRGITIGNLLINSGDIDKEIILKSSQTISCSIPTMPSVGVCDVTGQIYSLSQEITCNVSGTNFTGKKISVNFSCNDSTTPNINTVFSVDGSYHFYSMEYYN